MLRKYVRDTSASQRARALYRTRTPSPDSTDSGFGSDLDRLRATGCDVTMNANPTEDEKGKCAKTRRSPSNDRKWYRCDDITEDYSDADDVFENKSCPKTKRRASFSLDDVTLSEIRYLGVLGGGGCAKVDLVDIKR